MGTLPAWFFEIQILDGNRYAALAELALNLG
jgi:hypothetical protein